MEKYSVLMSLYIKEKPNYLRTAVDSMIGQTVQWATTDSEGKTTLHEGTAKSVSISDGAPSLMVETEVKDADGNISKAVTKVDISTLTRIGEGDLPE